MCVHRLYCNVDTHHSGAMMKGSSFHTTWPLEIGLFATSLLLSKCDFDGSRPPGDVKTFDERGRWVNVRRLGPSTVVEGFERRSRPATPRVPHVVRGGHPGSSFSRSVADGFRSRPTTGSQTAGLHGALLCREWGFHS